jgi:hypothetical protein
MRGDRGYFRASHEERLGATLEKSGPEHDTRVAIRQNFAALRMTLEAQPFSVASDRSTPTTRSSDHFKGRAASALSRCSRPTIRSIVA